MTAGPLIDAHQHLLAALAELTEHLAVATDDELVSVLTMCEGLTRRIDQLSVAAVAALQRRGTFAERGYSSPAAALRDVLGWERFEARRLVLAAEATRPRVALDGAVLPPWCPATAAAFAAGTASLRHVEAIDRVLSSAAAGRLSPEVWADAEAQLAAKTGVYTPKELQTWGEALIELLDADGAQPDDHEPALVNELHLHRHRRGGGRITARFDDAAMFDAIASVIDSGARPLTSDDDRSLPQRQAEALADACGHVLDHGDLPQAGGQRPHLNVIIDFDDLRRRARAATLDLGGRLTPDAVRMLACDAAVIPIVLGGESQPLDVGRTRRTIPDGLRRALVVRDRGCAHCGRPPSWTEAHHIREWENGGPTSLDNLVLLCRACHRMIHHSDWDVRLNGGTPEFLPPAWIDPQRRPRHRAAPHRLDAA